MDHVVASSFFRKPYPENLVTVPACSTCNRRKAKDDTFLRDALTSDIDANPSEAASTVFEAVRRSSLRDSSEFARLVRIQTLKRVPLVTPAGLYVGEAHGVTLPHGRIERCLFWIVRGLYFDHLKEPFPTDVVYEVRRHPASVFPELLSAIRQADGSDPPTRRMADVFGCAYGRGVDLRDSIWLLWFYEKALFSVITTPQPDPNSKPKASH